MVKALLSFLAAIMDYFRNRQLIEAGKAEQIVTETKEIETRVEKAKAVDRADDPEFDKRMRRRFDRAEGGGG